MESPTDTLGATVRSRREIAGVSQEALAYEAGVSIRTVIRLEQDAVKPTRATRAMVEAALRRLERRAARAEA